MRRNVPLVARLRNAPACSVLASILGKHLHTGFAPFAMINFDVRASPRRRPLSRAVLFVCKDDHGAVVSMFETALELSRSLSSWSCDFEFFFEPSVEGLHEYQVLHDKVCSDVLLSGRVSVGIWKAKPAEPAQCCNHLASHPGRQPGSQKRPRIDVILSMGGDGTVLHAAWQFQSDPVPPIIPLFLHGTLGFLTVFDQNLCKDLLHSFLLDHIGGGGPETTPESDGPPLDICLQSRMRISCRIVRNTLSEGCSLKSSFLSDWSSETSFLEEETFHVLNEAVIDRGPFSCLLQLELLIDEGVHLTTILSDGVVIATPTGSTAYSV